LTPLAGAILAAVVLPPLILLYFLKLRRRTQPIGSTLLWKRSVEDLRANSPFQRLRFSILLLLQLLALCLLAASIMQPQIQAGSRKGGKTVFLIDNSGSMTATDGDDKGATRLDDAKKRAAALVEEMYAGGMFSASPGESMVIAFNERAEVFCRFSTAKQQILDAIKRIAPTHAETRLEEALKLARAYTTNPNPDDPTGRPVGDPATLELFSDGRISDLPEQVLRGEKLIYHQVGSPEPDNVAITSLAVERPYDRPSTIEVFASVMNLNFEAVECDVELSLNDTALRIETVKVPAATVDPATNRMAPGRNNVVFTPFEQPRGAIIEVRNLRADDLEADNAARVIVPPQKQLTVALVESKNVLLRDALEGIPMIGDLRQLSATEFAGLAATGATEQFDVVILDNVRPEVMAPGRYLVFGAPPPLDGLNPYGEPSDQIPLTSRDEHPSMRFVALDTVWIGDSQLIQPTEDFKPIAEGTSSPLVVELNRAGIHMVYVAFDPLDSNWPFQRSFVTFIYNAVEYLGHSGESITSEGFRPGQPLVARLPSAATSVRMRSPDGSTDAIEATDPGAFSWGPTRLSGVYTMTWSGEGGGEHSRAFAVNMLSETEPDIKPQPVIKIGQEDVEGTGKDDSAYTPLWPWAVGFTLAILMLEWWIYHRKTMV
jgi:hypothetical protein